MGGAGLTIVATVVVIGVLVFVHELGHFVAAKAAGIYVHRFSLGLGAPIRWLSFRRGETEYSVSWIPLGGYVKMASRLEDPSSAVLEGAAEGVAVPEDRFFESKPVWVRMIVILAGVTMNVLFAWAIFTGVLYLGGLPVSPLTPLAAVDTTGLPSGARALAAVQPGDEITAVNGASVATWEAFQRAVLDAPGDTVRVDFRRAGGVALVLPSHDLDGRRAVLRAVGPDLPAVILGVIPGRPGAQAGLAAGDTVLALAGAPVAHWSDMVDVISANAGKEVDVLVGRAGGRQTLHATPAPESLADSNGVVHTVGRLGIAGPLYPEAREPIGLGAATGRGLRLTSAMATTIVSVVKGMFAGQVSTRELGGPISIGMQAGQSARLGAESYLTFMAMISVNLAVLNLLPIPLLDGGQFLFLLAEGVTRRPVTGRIREWLTVAGLVAIVLLMLLAFSNDIRRLLGL